MAKPRKRWSTTILVANGSETRHRKAHPSQAAVYRWLQWRAEELAAGMLADDRSKVIVWLDERDGRGWQRFENVDLAELAAMTSTEA